MPPTIATLSAKDEVYFEYCWIYVQTIFSIHQSVDSLCELGDVVEFMVYGEIDARNYGFKLM